MYINMTDKPDDIITIRDEDHMFSRKAGARAAWHITAKQRSTYCGRFLSGAIISNPADRSRGEMCNTCVKVAFDSRFIRITSGK